MALGKIHVFIFEGTGINNAQNKWKPFKERKYAEELMKKISIN